MQALLASATLGSVYLESPLCQDGVMGACKSLASAIERLCRDAQVSERRRNISCRGWRILSPHIKSLFKYVSDGVLRNCSLATVNVIL